MASISKLITNLPTISVTKELALLLEKGELVVMCLGNINNLWWWLKSVNRVRWVFNIFRGLVNTFLVNKEVTTFAVLATGGIITWPWINGSDTPSDSMIVYYKIEEEEEKKTKRRIEEEDEEQQQQQQRRRTKS
ncbi:unnamed protein product [Arabidopsis halleri]